MKHPIRIHLNKATYKHLCTRAKERGVPPPKEATIIITERLSALMHMESLADLFVDEMNEVFGLLNIKTIDPVSTGFNDIDFTKKPTVESINFTLWDYEYRTLLKLAVFNKISVQTLIKDIIANTISTEIYVGLNRRLLKKSFNRLFDFMEKV